MPRRFDAGPVLAAIGALLLLGSLFVDWYEPGVSAWTVFEVWDLVLAVAAIATLADVASRARPGALAGERTLPLLGGLALLIVASQLLNHPPAAFDDDPQTGAWLGLGGAALMFAGGVLAVARVQLAVTPREAGAEPPARAEAAAAEPEVQDELYPAEERTEPLGADDPETVTVEDTAVRPPGNEQRPG